METKISKWGNSLGLRIPRVLAEEMAMGAGSRVDLKLEKGHLVVRVLPEQKESLADLLAQVRPDNLHGETDSGPPTGRETW